MLVILRECSLYYHARAQRQPHLLDGNSSQNFLLVDVLRQRQLHDDAVDFRVCVQLLHLLQEL